MPVREKKRFADYGRPMVWHTRLQRRNDSAVSLWAAKTLQSKHVSLVHTETDHGPSFAPQVSAF